MRPVRISTALILISKRYWRDNVRIWKRTKVHTILVQMNFMLDIVGPPCSPGTQQWEPIMRRFWSLAVGRLDCSPDKSDRLYRRVVSSRTLRLEERERERIQTETKQADHTMHPCVCSVDTAKAFQSAEVFDRPVSSAIASVLHHEPAQKPGTSRSQCRNTLDKVQKSALNEEKALRSGWSEEHWRRDMI